MPVTLPRASLITRQSCQSMKAGLLRLVLLLPFLPQKAHMRVCIGSSPSGGSSSTSSSDDDDGGGGDGERIARPSQTPSHHAGISYPVRVQTLTPT